MQRHTTRSGGRGVNLDDQLTDRSACLETAVRVGDAVKLAYSDESQPGNPTQAGR